MRKRRFTTAIVTGAGALVCLSLSSALGNIHGHTLHEKLFALVAGLAFLVLSIVAVQSVTSTISALVAARAGRSGGIAVRVVMRLVGYVVVVFVTLGVLAVPVQHLLIGGALTSVIVGIAAQQSLGNVFAGLVLLLARPFTVDEKVRVHNTSLGGPLDGVVRSVNLAYVTLDTDRGLMNIPNSTMLSTAVGPAPAEDDVDDAIPRVGAPVPETQGSATVEEPTGTLIRVARNALGTRRAR